VCSFIVELERPRSDALHERLAMKFAAAALAAYLGVLHQHVEGASVSSSSRMSAMKLKPKEAMEEHLRLRGKKKRSKKVQAGEVVARNVCIDDPVGWVSNTSRSCAEYEQFEWCTSEGDPGKNWHKDHGSFEDWAPEGGVAADEACCICGGGSNVDVLLADPGVDSCGDDEDVVDDQATCEATAHVMEAQFYSSADWPKGHSIGCHTDKSSSGVWFNTDKKADDNSDFRLICLRDAWEEDQYESTTTTTPRPLQLERWLLKDPRDRKTLDTLRAAVALKHKELRKLLKEQVHIGTLLKDLRLGGKPPVRDDIDAGVAGIRKESNSPAFADLVGDMWKEMRMFSTPFYEEKLTESLEQLRKASAAAEGAYHGAKMELVAFEKEKLADLS